MRNAQVFWLHRLAFQGFAMRSQPPDALATAARTARVAQAGLSPAHFHHVFKADTGLTPKAYAQAERARRLRQQLGRPEA